MNSRIFRSSLSSSRNFIMGYKLLLLSFFLCILAVKSAPNDEIAAQYFVQDSSPKIYNIINGISDLTFDTTEFENIKKPDDSSGENHGDLSKLEMVFAILAKFGTMQDLFKNFTYYSDEAGKFDYEHFRNEELKLAVKNTHLSPNMFILGPESFGALGEANKALRGTITTKNLCEFKNRNSCTKSYANILDEIVRKSNNQKEVQFHWQQWRDLNKGIHRENLEKIVEFVRSAARHFNINSRIFWFIDFLDENFIYDMEKVVTELQPLYKEFHALIRSILNRRFGENTVPSNGLIPHHLFEKILVKTWNPNGFLAHMFTQEDITNMKRVLREKGVTAPKIIEYANDFYRSLGFENLPNEFWTSHLKKIGDEEKDDFDCKASIIDATPKVYLKYCPQVDMKKFLQMHQWMGRLYYATQKKDLLYGNFKSHLLEHPVGEAAILSATTPKRLNSLGLISNTRYDSYEHDMDRLLRNGIHAILNIPVYYVNSKVMTDVITGSVSFDRINEHYWNLMKTHVGVSPPVTRQPDDIDFPYYFYDNIEQNYHARKFMSEVMGYQIYQSLCEKSGQYTPNQQDLHKCDFYGSRNAGQALRDMMKAGSTKPWKQVLSIVTGNENGMSAEGILAYYAPLKNWLQQQNVQNRANVGW